MRLIDADAFDERVRAAGGMSEEELTEDFKDGVQAVLYMLSNQPTIQPEPHKGHWEPVGMAEAVGGESAMWGSAIAYHECSECGKHALEEYGEEKLSDFCPHCGARMEVYHE